MPANTLLSTLSALLLLSSVNASPAQFPFQASSSLRDPNKAPFDFKHHLAGISPYHAAGGQVNDPPEGCSVVTATYLVRHSAITANDDEWDDYMKPFTQKLKKYKFKKSAKKSDLGFLKSWKSPVNDDNLEQMTDLGGSDSKFLGKRMRSLYPHLLPNNTEPFEIWAAAASRDINTAKEFIKGVVPDHAEDGTGDGHVSLIKVPLHNVTGWDNSLTPHKICSAFTKKNGKPEKEYFEKQYTKSAIKRFEKALPGFGFKTNDIVGMQMLCGYQLVIEGSSPLCDLFTKEDWLSFEYGQDLHYNKMVGHAAPYAPYLGYPWLNTATYHLLHPTGHPDFSASDLPPPSKPPNTTSVQNLFFYFTHREEVPVVLTTLGLFKDEQGTLSKDAINRHRIFRSSRIIPFLGHVALERMHCDEKKEGDDTDFVRILVNEAYVALPECNSGPGASCPIGQFRDFVQDKKEKFGDFQRGCQKP